MTEAATRSSGRFLGLVVTSDMLIHIDLLSDVTPSCYLDIMASCRIQT
jgi:hypothetical protein